MIAPEVKQVEPGAVLETLTALKAEGYNVLVDFTAIDWSALQSGPKGDDSDRLKRAHPFERSDRPGAIAHAKGEEYGTPKLRLTPDPFLAARPARFEVVYRLMKLDAAAGEDKGRVDVRAFVPEGEPVLKTARGLWPIADWLEREVWDMFGIGFVDRSDIKRLLLPDSFVGHPLRKDYPLTKRQPLIGPPEALAPDSPTFNQGRKEPRYE